MVSEARRGGLHHARLHRGLHLGDSGRRDTYQARPAHAPPSGGGDPCALSPRGSEELQRWEKKRKAVPPHLLSPSSRPFVSEPGEAGQPGVGHLLLISRQIHSRFENIFINASACHTLPPWGLLVSLAALESFTGCCNTRPGQEGVLLVARVGAKVGVHKRIHPSGQPFSKPQECALTGLY